MSKYLETSKGLNFYNQVVKPESSEKKTIEVPAHHTFIIDCSGSMYGELSTIRRDLYNKISTLLKPNDSVTIIWFSGRGQCGVILEDYNVSSAIKLNQVKDLIDRHLTPRGLTAFKEPIEKMQEVIKEVHGRNPEKLHTMFFLTDGYDNQWSTKEIISTIEGVKEELSSATIVEYGWYCNKQLLNQMATAVGGVHTFSENFDEYEPYVEKAFTGGQSVKRRYIKLDHTPHNNVVFNIVDGDIITYLPNEDNEIFVSVDGEVNLFYFTDETPSATRVGNEDFVSNAFLNGDTSDPIIAGLYGAAFAYSRTSDYNTVSDILKVLGDAYLITEKANTFGTQKINELEAKFISAMNDITERYREGYNPELEPAEDAFCVLDMLEVLMTDDENLWYPRHEAFSYKRTGGKAVAKRKGMSEDDKDELSNLLESGDLDALQNKLNEVKENETEALKFHFNEDMPGCPISNLTWNESRANLSVQVLYNGYVNLPKNNFNLPEKFDTKIFRNYTIIKDGIIHTYQLPVSLSQTTFDTLQANGLLEGETYEADKIYILNFEKLPVINRKMIQTLSAEEMFEKSYELLKLQAANTAFTQYKKRLFDGASKGFKDLYGEEATEWLKELGLKDYGFNPPSTVEKMGEEIEVNTLEIKIKGLASNPTKADFDKAEQKLKAGIDINSLSGKEALIAPAIKEFLTFEETLSGLNDDSRNKMIEEWLYSKSESFRKAKTKLMTEISQAKFLIIVGKSWFKEFASRNDNELNVELDGNEITCTVVDKQTTIKL